MYQKAEIKEMRLKKKVRRETNLSNHGQSHEHPSPFRTKLLPLLSALRLRQSLYAYGSGIFGIEIMTSGNGNSGTHFYFEKCEK